VPSYETHIEVPVTVHYDYDEGQKYIKNPPDQAQEGIPESVGITEVMTSGFYTHDLTDLVNDSDKVDLEVEILDSIKSIFSNGD